MGNLQEATAPGGLAFGDVAKVRIERSLTMTPESEEFLDDLARRTGLNEGNVVRLGLLMLKAALDAKDQGNHVGFAKTADALDLEFVGF